ncbi:MAG: hypothetical protein ABL894_09480 [Hyphomicrobium sp.]
MSIDQVLRAIGTVACLYTVGLSVSAMTVASLGAISYSTASLCSGRNCGASVVAQHHAAPATAYEAVFVAPMMMFSSTP